MRKRTRRNRARAAVYLSKRRKAERMKKMHPRRLPPLYKAIAAWGEDAVLHPAPEYVPKGHCQFCGGKLEGRRRAFCSDACRNEFYKLVVWERGRGSYSTQILRRDAFSCTECGEVHAYVNSHGIRLPVSDGELEVHHIEPVSMGGGHAPWNLRTLCRRCHKGIHAERRARGLPA